MIGYWRYAAFLLALVFMVPACVAQENVTSKLASEVIRYKQEQTPIDEYGSRVVLTLTFLLVVTVIGILMVRKLLFRNSRIFLRESRVKLIEQHRLNQRSTVYLMQVDQGEVLLIQCGETILQVDMPRELCSSKGEISSGEIMDVERV